MSSFRERIVTMTAAELTQEKVKYATIMKWALRGQLVAVLLFIVMSIIVIVLTLKV